MSAVINLEIRKSWNGYQISYYYERIWSARTKMGWTDFAVPKVGHAWSRCGGVSNWEVNDGISMEKRRLCKENGQILVQPSYKQTGLFNLGLDDQSFFSEIGRDEKCELV